MIRDLPDKVYEAVNLLGGWVISEYDILEWRCDKNSITWVRATNNKNTISEFNLRDFNTGLVAFNKNDIEPIIADKKKHENDQPKYRYSVYRSFRVEVCTNCPNQWSCNETYSEIEKCKKFENYYEV